VTGGAGFIGSHVVETYLKVGHEVIVVDNHRTGQNRPEGADFYNISINDPQTLDWVFLTTKPDVVNHHAAQVGIPDSMRYPSVDAELNIQGTIHVLEAARKYDVKQFIFASTAEVYGTQKQFPLVEDTPLNPESPYAISKLSAEYYVRFYGRTYLDYITILRYANIYGPRQNPAGGAVIPRFISQLLMRKPLTIQGGGTQTRDFLYVKDVAEANLKALDIPGTFNIGSGEQTSILQLATLLEAIVVSSSRREHDVPRLRDVEAFEVSSSLAERVLEWKPTTSLAQGLRETVNDMSSLQMVQ